jgi:hypothetical protein
MICNNDVMTAMNHCFNVSGVNNVSNYVRSCHLLCSCMYCVDCRIIDSHLDALMLECQFIKNHVIDVNV